MQGRPHLLQGRPLQGREKPGVPCRPILCPLDLGVGQSRPTQVPEEGVVVIPEEIWYSGWEWGRWPTSP